MDHIRNSNDAARNNSPFGDEADLESRLWDYIDGTSTEPSVIAKLIVENAAWTTKYAELLDIHQVLHNSELEEPSLRFTKNVMEDIGRLQITTAAKQYIDSKIIWGIAAFFITVIVSFLVYGFSQIEWSAVGSSGKVAGSNFTGIDYSKVFNNSFVNLFMMLNVVLGLMLLDRFLSMKKKRLFKR